MQYITEYQDGKSCDTKAKYEKMGPFLKSKIGIFNMFFKGLSDYLEFNSK